MTTIIARSSGPQHRSIMHIRSIVVFLACMAALPGRPCSAQSQPSAAEPEPRMTNAGALTQQLRRGFPSAYERVDAAPVAVRMLVSGDGGIDSMDVVSSSGFSALDEVVLAALRQAKFTPQKDGPAAAWLHLWIHPGGGAVGERSTPPALLNRGELIASAQARHPPELKLRRIVQHVPLLLTIGPDGRVASYRALEPGCFPSAEHVAQDFVKQFVFESAAGTGTRQVAATVMFDDSVELLLPGDERPATAIDHEASEPRGRGETRMPRLSNEAAVRRALVANYPDALRKQGRGGTTHIRTEVDEQGGVIRRRISRSSGLCELDRAALEVAATMHFSPALSRGHPIRVWVEIPIVFSSR
jgi:TonB family protein